MHEKLLFSCSSKFLDIQEIEIQKEELRKQMHYFINFGLVVLLLLFSAKSYTLWKVALSGWVINWKCEAVLKKYNSSVPQNMAVFYKRKCSFCCCKNRISRAN